MASSSSAAAGRCASPTRSATSTPHSYIRVPEKLLLDLHDTPLAVGIYTLIMRLVVTTKTPVPLSGPDIIAFDPHLNRGQVVRALNRLTDRGWLTSTYAKGKKAAYLPTWGRINGTPRAWTPDTTEPSNGRPRHVQIYKVDCGFIDICMGKLDLHERNRAIITRYLSTPISGLRDLGIYTLALANLHQGATTPALQRLGVLAPNQDPRPLSPDTTILAIASQQTLFTEELTLTRQGVAKLGLRAAPARQAPDTTQPLFFIPSDQFGTLTVPLIDSMIGACEDARSGNTASPSDESNQPNIALGSHVLPCTHMKNMEKAAPQPPTGGGNISACDCSSGKCAPQARATIAEQPVETESAQLLRDSGVKSATLIRQLGQLPIDIVMKAISTARSRPTTQDVGGVACSMLRDFRNHATPIPDPVRSGNSGATAAEIRESFLRLGYPLSDPSPADPRRAEDNLARQAAGVVWDAPCSTPDPVIKLWNGLLAALQTQIPRSEFNTWFRHMALLSVESGVALIQAPNLRTKDAIERRYLGTLRDLLRMVTGEPLRVQVLLRSDPLSHGQMVGAAAAPGMDMR